MRFAERMQDRVFDALQTAGEDIAMAAGGSSYETRVCQHWRGPRRKLVLRILAVPIEGAQCDAAFTASLARTANRQIMIKTGNLRKNLPVYVARMPRLDYPTNFVRIAQGQAKPMVIA